MSVAGKAYRIAEERIERAKASGSNVLSLSPYYAEDGKYRHYHTPELRALRRLPTEIADLTHLQRLYLSNTQVADISPLAGMTAMQTLTLNNMQVADISPLADMTTMQRLTLNNTHVADISPLTDMTNMRRLYLEDTQVADISPLAEITAMQRLWLSNTKADLGQLVAIGAAWAEDDLAMRSLKFDGTPATRKGECLEGVHGNDAEARTKAALAALRAERDRRWAEVPPAITPAPEHGHIFLSYARADASTAKILRQALESDGVAIWQDVDMAIGTRFRDEIDARIDGAAGVLTLWSDASAASDYVISEADRGRQANKFVPALLSPLVPPTPFDGFNTADLSGWSGDRTHADYQRLVSRTFAMKARSKRFVRLRS